MVQLAAWMNVVLHSWQTPYEHAAILERKLPGHQHEVAEITHQYVHETFSPAVKPTDSGLIYRSNQAWHRLRSAIVKAAIRQRLPRWLVRP
jgi:hypothetical protein